MRFHNKYNIVVRDPVRKRYLQSLIKIFIERQHGYVLRGNWSRVVDIDIKLNVLRSELYGKNYCGERQR
jgi:hypothetical protein